MLSDITCTSTRFAIAAILLVIHEIYGRIIL
jgi:hypothetical protein